jgi:hypothetical protein
LVSELFNEASRNLGSLPLSRSDQGRYQFSPRYGLSVKVHSQCNEENPPELPGSDVPEPSLSDGEAGRQLTLIVPVIVEEWKLHLYEYVPAVLNWKVNVSPAVSRVCELHTPVVLVLV